MRRFACWLRRPIWRSAMWLAMVSEVSDAADPGGERVAVALCVCVGVALLYAWYLVNRDK